MSKKRHKRKKLSEEEQLSAAYAAISTEKLLGLLREARNKGREILREPKDINEFRHMKFRG